MAENRTRYLDKLGILDDRIDSVIDETSKAIENLVDVDQKLEDGEGKITEYPNAIEEIKSTLKKKHHGRRILG
ncbi:hypothetical protein [Flagellimonas algicola]|uniref:t-SNARE coiled-coil homology domain-containing protein n=1 Tax=Flagellimonas algicola TaxID=2583815 RepID=A0ABY2WFU9_9FLAO|nr:hypothetical protein [Allomuricauda algicola]TMU50403.1 hypothetical protein FGG15_19845 [Allomuricauda algicola]